MSASSILKEIKKKRRESHRLYSLANLSKVKGEIEQEKYYLGEAMEKDDVFRKWFRQTIMDHPDQVCALVREKTQSMSIPSPLEVHEASYPEVIEALDMFAEYELRPHLPETCILAYKKMRR